MSIYVEIRIHGAMEDLWQLTQVPHLHGQWDLRFTDIEYLPRPDESLPQRFVYTTRIGFGIAIRGEGETVGSRDEAQGSRTSALKFSSNDAKSLIREGSGYWQYVPTDDGIRFLTSYDYHVRYGVIGKVVDRILFRPLMGWATTWSFDRLRLWIENGISPAISMQRTMIHTLARGVIGFVWIYQGVIPKLIYRQPDELLMIQQAGFSVDSAPGIRLFIGLSEIVFGIVVLALPHAIWPFVVTLLLMIVALAGVVINSPHFLATPFNATSLNVLMIAMALVGILASRDLPSARRCLRKKPE